MDECPRCIGLKKLIMHLEVRFGQLENESALSQARVDLAEKENALLRASGEKERQANALLQALESRLREILGDEDPGPPCDSDCLKQVKGFNRDYGEFSGFNPRNGDCGRFMRLIRKHEDELWAFLTEDVPWHNNVEELSIRRSVVNRKMSNGNGIDLGARV